VVSSPLWIADVISKFNTDGTLGTEVLPSYGPTCTVPYVASAHVEAADR